MTTQDFENAISRLIVDSRGVAFTGFVTYARMEPPPVLVGEVWRHASAEASGRFADGRRIHTSHVIEAHFAGDSVWVVTETGSAYGIISFAPLGWQWFGELMRMGDDRPFSPLCVIHGEPLFTTPPSTPLESRPFGDLKRRNPASAREPSPGTGKRHPFRPPSDAKYVQQIKDHFDKSIAALRKHGVSTPQQGNPGRSKESDNFEVLGHGSISTLWRAISICFSGGGSPADRRMRVWLVAHC